MQFETFSHELNKLSKNAFAFIQEGEFEQCIPLLSARQLLLEQLHQTLDSMGLLESDNDTRQHYIKLLNELKQQDSIVTSYLEQQRHSTLQQMQQQSKINKAIKAYQQTPMR